MALKTKPGTVFHDVATAAERLDMGRSTLYRLIRAGKVPHHVMPTGVIRFTDQDLDDIRLEASRPPIRIKPNRRAA